jgi:hypothetical protein
VEQEHRPHAIIDEDLAAPGPEVPSARCLSDELPGVLAVSPDAYLLDPAVPMEMIAVELRSHEEGLRIRGHEEQERPLSGLLVKAAQIVEVRAQREHK